uniref:Biotin carboxyl carrier protein of acetyl-CoA carboxylase n=1 Tax=Herposiphonia versicolor TaxID=2007163 RepID=A0A1Z1MFY4_9FLOR|nr:acetyl-CoA carboxylase biotin carboxyl carrier protein [Herposiphonia versicolor]ARW64799.1 acetyl-CoA carboxylase biotin carboxyl carrier protein [Herposiphonia versicolor]
MKVKEIQKLINSISNNDASGIIIKKRETKITINKTKLINENRVLKNNISKLKKIEVKQKIQVNNNKENKLDQAHVYSTIISPMVGTFYNSPAPNEPSFIEIGDIVKPKQTVCIIEAMKLMNEIESEVNGEIVEILVKNGDIVDCGQALVKIKIK